MSKQIKIAFCGRSGAGKDTAAEILSKHLNFRQYAFADPVKQAVEAAFPLFNFAKYGKNDVIPKIGKSKRQLWQTLGTEWGREMVYENIWVDALLRKLRRVQEMHPNHSPNFVVTDARMENEISALLSEGFHVIKVVRSVNTLSDDTRDHKSENGVDHLFCHEVLHNDGTLVELEDKLLRIVERLTRSES